LIDNTRELIVKLQWICLHKTRLYRILSRYVRYMPS